MPDEQRPYPDNLPPEVAFRQLPARQPHASRAATDGLSFLT